MLVILFFEHIVINMMMFDGDSFYSFRAGRTDLNPNRTTAIHIAPTCICIAPTEAVSHRRSR